MSANSLHIDLPSEEQPSLFPWMIVLACSAILLVLMNQTIKAIPQKLEVQAQSIIDTAGFPDLKAVANGRNLQVSGNINITNSTGTLLNRLAQIEGVRYVQDNIVIVDPALQQQESAARFANALAGIDTTSVNFQPGRISFTPDSDIALAQLLTLMQTHNDARVRIEGHTDNTGADSVNLRVSRDRAAAVANFLMARGIPADRLIVTGYGSTQPIADNNTESGRSQNRRIEINMIK